MRNSRGNPHFVKVKIIMDSSSRVLIISLDKVVHVYLNEVDHCKTVGIWVSKTHAPGQFYCHTTEQELINLIQGDETAFSCIDRKCSDIDTR